MNDAFSERQCRPGFAAPLSAPDLDGTEGGKQSLQTFVHEAGAVRQGLFVPYEIITSFTSLKWAYSIFEGNDTLFPREIVIDFRDKENCAGGALDGESVLSSLGVGRRVCLSRGSVMFVDELIDKFAEIGKLLVIVGNQKKLE